VDSLLGDKIATCDPVSMEILAGARDERHLRDLRRLLASATLLALESIDYEEAAALYRICRRNGETPRKLIDCLIAAIAIRADAAVLHQDADFDVLSRHTLLRIDSAH
jgi:predicted nucleic acid-binding protein